MYLHRLWIGTADALSWANLKATCAERHHPALADRNSPQLLSQAWLGQVHVPIRNQFSGKKGKIFWTYFEHILKILQRLEVFWKYVALDAQRNIEAGVWCEPNNCAGLRPKLVGRDSTRGSLWHAFGLVWSLTDWCWWCWPCLWHVSRALCSNICRWFFVSCFFLCFSYNIFHVLWFAVSVSVSRMPHITLTAPTDPPTTFPLHSTSFPRPSSQWRNLEWIDYIPLQVAMDYCPIAKKWCSKLCQLPRLQQEDGQIDKTYSIDCAGKTFELIQSVRHMCFGLLQLALDQATLLRVIFPRHYSHYALKHVPDTTSLSQSPM